MKHLTKAEGHIGRNVVIITIWVEFVSILNRLSALSAGLRIR